MILASQKCSGHIPYYVPIKLILMNVTHLQFIEKNMKTNYFLKMSKIGPWVNHEKGLYLSWNIFFYLLTKVSNTTVDFKMLTISVGSGGKRQTL